MLSRHAVLRYGFQPAQSRRWHAEPAATGTRQRRFLGKAQDPGQLLQRDLCFAQVAQRDLLAHVFPQDLEGGAFGFQMPLQGAGVHAKEVGNVVFLAARAAERVAQRLPHSGSQALARRFESREIVDSDLPQGFIDRWQVHLQRGAGDVQTRMGLAKWIGAPKNRA